jgi:hypothetical protein
MKTKIAYISSCLQSFLTGRTMGKLSAVLVAALLLTGCTARVGDYTFVSTKSMDLESPVGFKTETYRRTSGEDISHLIFCLFPTKANVSIKEAIDRAIHQNPGCVGLANVVVYQRIVVIPLIYGQVGWIVVGDPIYKKRTFGSDPTPTPPQRPATSYPTRSYSQEKSRR